MKIFFAFGFSKYIEKETKTVNESVKEFLCETRNELIARGYDVFLAHFREKWGKDLMLPEQCTPLDLEEMKNTDFVVAFPGEQELSGGVHVELGWASILKKKILLFLKEGVEYSPLITGLGTITQVRIVRYQHLDKTDVLQEIRKGL